MNYLPYIVGGYVLGRVTRDHGQRGRRAAAGLCFPWALEYITKHPEAVLLQGQVRTPLSRPPHWYWHGWIIHNGRVKDWQTMVRGDYPKFRQEGWPIPLWMEAFTPRFVEEYDREEAWAACRTAGQHAGPWHGPESEGEKSWANRGRRNVGTKDRTGVKIFQPAPWPPCPTDASDTYCPLHGETYRQFNPGISYEGVASMLRDHGGRLGEGSTGAFGKKARHGDVLRLMGVMKTNAWRERHGCCVVDQDDQWEHRQDYYVSRAKEDDPQSWGWTPEPRSNKDLICLTDKQTGPKCFVGTRRRPTGRVRPPLGGADCRDPHSGKFTTCATGDTRLGPRKKKR